MLVRAYRFTDKFGIVLLKSSSALTQYTLTGIGLLTTFGAGALVVLSGVASILWQIFGAPLRFIWYRLGIPAVQIRQAGGTATTIMARRAARAEMQAAIAEDPLRSQNRLLSLFALVLLTGLIAVVLWATNPSRNSTTNDLPFSNSSGSSNLSFLVTGGSPTPTTSALLSTPVPTATVLPLSLEVRGAIAYTGRDKGQDDIWALSVGDRTPIRLTNDPADDRDPAWSPDGQKLAYASHQDGNWELYVYDLGSGQTTRMTYDLSFQGAPQWSPDGKWLVYESYQGNNLDVYVVPVDGSQPAQRVTQNPAPDFSPSWSPDGRRIAFVSWRDGNQDIYVFSLDNPVDAASVNLTNTPTRQEDYPAWSPDGKLIAYSAVDEGIEKIFVKQSDRPEGSAEVLERGHAPAWSPDGTSLIFTVESLEGTQFVAAPFAEAGISTSVIGVSNQATDPMWTKAPLSASLVSSGGLGSSISQSLFIEQVNSRDQDNKLRLNTIGNVEVARSLPYLNDAVNDSFISLRQRALQDVGWDFLGQLDDAFWDMKRLPDPGEERRNWYMTGRAFGVNRNLIAGFPAEIELVREDLGVNTYWRVYVRVADEAQAGQLGEPLRRMPWDMLSRNGGDVQAYDQGGRLKTEVPPGYYIDFTQLAQDYGWLRSSAGNDWRANYNGINYWLFLKIEGLTWYQAMRDLYTDSELGGFAATATPEPATQQPESG
jgi:TolB protein